MATKKVDYVSARLRAISLPAFSHLRRGLFTMIPVETRMVPTAGIDMFWRCYWNPDFFAKLSADQAACVLVHELWHRLRRHGERGKLLGVTEDTHNVWNWATDAEIHEGSGFLLATLRSIDSVSPAERSQAPIPLPERHTSETWYQLLCRAAEYLPLPSVGNCGSGATGTAAKWELPDDVSNVTKTSRVFSEEGEVVRRAVASAMRAASIGTIPAGWLRWAKDVETPTQSWLGRLDRVFGSMTSTAIATKRWTYRRPSRRPAFGGVVLPGWVGTVPRLAFLLDTSGSVSDVQLGVAIGQIRASIARLASGGAPPTVVVYSCDAATSTGREIWETSKLELVGGGGTDLRLGMAAIDRDHSRCRYDLSVVITDGCTPWPDAPPAVPTLVLLFDDVSCEDLRLPGWSEISPHGWVVISGSEAFAQKPCRPI